ncbi:MAG: 50S ribosomal protein L5 [Candidatus Vogelbacteria bacterium]
MIPLKEKYEKILPQLATALGEKNRYALPRLAKVVINAGLGKLREKKQLALVVDRLSKITGQKPSPRGAKKSIASFKVREGETIGQMVTLRGKRMYGFLDKLINVAVPRMRDFRGFDEKSVDASGNLTISIREHTIFPETSDEDLKDVFGFAITIVTTAQNRDQALVFFRAIGFPFKKA